MTIELTNFLSRDEILECIEESHKRVKMHFDDAQQGQLCALNSYGGTEQINCRNFNTRKSDALIGCLAEKISSKCAKCHWSKEIGQYKYNSNPDLQVIYNGKQIDCEVRGTRKTDSIIYRPDHDNKYPNMMLIAVTNLPYGPICNVGYIFFSELQQLANCHPEWIGKHPGKRYYNIPFNNLSINFLEFGHK